MQYHNKRRLLLGITIVLFILLYLFQASNTIRVFTVIFGLYFFYFFDHLFNVKFKLHHYLAWLIILIFGAFLAELYYVSELYDKVLHLIMPFVFCILVYYAIDKLKIEFRWKLLLTFTSVLAALGIFEIGEFLLDQLFKLNLQGVYLRDVSGLDKITMVMDKNTDTMIDMSFGLMGSLAFVIFGWLGWGYKRVEPKIKNKLRKMRR